MNMANMIPKISSKILGRKTVLERSAVRDDGKPHYSISFYVEAVKC